MAKTAKIKKKQSTLHSRAARRATSPSLNLDKSLKPAATTHHSPPTVTSKPHVLAAKPAGVTKKSKSKSKPLKRQQRVRQQKTIERAADALDKLELKKQKSVGKERKVRERRKGWEEVNMEKDRKERGREKRVGNAFEGLDEDGEKVRGEREWVSDEEMPEVEGRAGNEDDVVLSEIEGPVKELEVVVPASIPLPQATVEEDEML